MTNHAIIIRHLSFTGPRKEPTSVEFGSGLNVIYGASETGKSFILEALDFMMGAGGDLRDIPERVGYNRIFLSFQIGEKEEYTFERSTSGGDFRCFSGLHTSVPDDIEPEVLKAKHSAKNESTVSGFLLKKIGLWDSRIRKNVRGDTNSLSFRNLAHLTMISEGDIQKRSSPLLTGQHISKTAELSVFKLLLSGVDDSAVQAEVRDEKAVLSRAAKTEVIDELIADNKSRLEDLIGDEDKDELENQIERLEASLRHDSNLLQSTEAEYQIIIGKRNEKRKQIELITNRCTEIDEMLARFGLLDQHYQSDLSRLEGVREAGSLVAALSPENCPLCGATPNAQHLDAECDGNIDGIISATIAESNKIVNLRKELSETVAKLQAERERYKTMQPDLLASIESIESELKEISPDLSDKRAEYSELVDKRNEVQYALNIMNSIAELEERRENIDEEPTTQTATSSTIADLSASTLNEFSILMENILQEWEFPDSDRVYFDKETSDIVISGKHRGSRGKGLRAITHAAFTLGIMKFAEDSELPHPGFVVIDTPLLAYREPEGDDDDLRGTAVQQKFYEYLSAWSSRQVIILENEDPPGFVKESNQTIFFSKNPALGRYGFLPYLKTSEET